jgi:hypothetical protein
MAAEIPVYEVVPRYSEDMYPGGPGGTPMGRFTLKTFETANQPSRYEVAMNAVDRLFPAAHGNFTMRVLRRGEKLSANNSVDELPNVYADGEIVVNIGLDPIRE